MNKETLLKKLEAVHPRYLNICIELTDTYGCIPTKDDPFGEIKYPFEEVLQEAKDRAKFFMDNHI